MFVRVLCFTDGVGVRTNSTPNTESAVSQHRQYCSLYSRCFFSEIGTHTSYAVPVKTEKLRQQ